MQIRLSLLIGRIVARAILAASLLPALALVTDLPGWNNVFPLDARRAFGIFTRHITAGREIHPVTGVFAAAIKFGGLWGVQLPGNFLGFVEGARCVSLGPHGEQQQQQSKTADNH